MKKLYAVVAAMAVMLPLLYLLHQQATAAQHQKELQACTERFERIRTAAGITSIDLYPFHKQRWDYVWVSNFDGGLAAFSGTWKEQRKRGFVDFNGNIILEYQGDAKIDGFVGFGGFKHGHTEIFVYKHEAVPWGQG